MELELATVSETGSEAGGVRFLLEDKRVPDRRFALCVTDDVGRCEAEISYRFSESSWGPARTARRILKLHRRRDPLRIVAVRDGVEVKSTNLGELSNRAQTGYETVKRTIRLP